MCLSIKQPYNARFLAVRVAWEKSPYPNLVRVYEHKPDNMYWGLGGLTHCEWNPQRITIVKDYGVLSDHDDDAIDEIDRQWYAEFPPIPAASMTLSEGWISPEGVFYDCAYGEHTFLASHIGHSFYGHDRGEREIEKTWVRVYKSMAMITLDGQPTDAQLKTLLELLAANPNEPQFLKGFREFCELRDIEISE
jgi:hypothetical protein